MANDSGNGKAASSSDAADSYIGSFISLTSKSEFRYEGVLYFLNPQTSVLGLKNVRSFGTEGRKKDGPQVPPSDNVYDYIMFRGSDIKDLEVKISPPAQAEEATDHDPAIIQSQCVGDLSSSSKPVSLGGGSLPDLCSYKEPSKLNMTPYPIVPSSHQSGNQFGELGLPYLPTPNPKNLGSNIPPTQLQGSNAAASSSHYANLYPILPVTTPHSMTCDFPQVYPAQAPVQTSSLTPSSQMPLNLTPNLASQQLLVAPASTYFQHLPSPISSSCESRTTESPAVCKSGPHPIPPFPANSLLYPLFSFENNIVSPSLKQPPSLPTLDKLSQGRLSALPPAETSYPDQKDFHVMSSESLNSLHSVKAAVQAPLLPLPSVDKLQSSEFTEEFDFVAMNEKFNKDEVWGYLGKAKKRDTKALVSENMENDSVLIVDADSRPAYSKDDFFDNISRNTVTRGPRNVQNHFNGGVVKLNNETFGNFQQSMYPGYGGYGAGRGLNHGSFGWGRGYNYRGRGRGVYM